MNSRLAVEKDEVRTDGAASLRHRSLSQESTILGQRGEKLINLGKDENTLILTGGRGIVRLSSHGMDLFRWFQGRTDC